MPRPFDWFHTKPEGRDADPRDLKATPLAGKVNQVGQIWSRMLPLLEDSSSPGKASPQRGGTPANPMARPSPTARPGAATARPAAAALARPGRSGGVTGTARGDASITPWAGRYLESLVLFRHPRDPRLTGALERVLDRGADAEFTSVPFKGP